LADVREALAPCLLARNLRGAVPRAGTEGLVFRASSPPSRESRIMAHFPREYGTVVREVAASAQVLYCEMHGYRWSQGSAFVVEAANGRLSWLAAKEESVSLPILGIGNTNSRYHLVTGAKQLISHWTYHGPAHHGAVGSGHIARNLEKLAAYGIDFARAC
jgi:hypothetical protein